MPVIDAQLLIENRVHAIRDMHERVGNSRAQLDLSGGIDSGVMLGLLARSVGPENVTAVYSSIHSGIEFRDRARLCAAAFDVALVELDLSEMFDSLTEIMQFSLAASGVDLKVVKDRIANDRSVLGSLRSCLRAPIGRGYNRLTGGGIRHGTGNECEDRFLRFYQKGGDGEVDSNPLDMLGKGEVFQLARALEVPRSLIEAVPSPDLHAIGSAHNDEDELRESTGVHWTYSRISPDTGEYTRVGSIERMSRFLDDSRADALLASKTPNSGEFATLTQAAQPFFPGYSAHEIEGLLRSCRKLEAASRHKANPNIPSLGTRAELLQAGILTDTFPILE